MSAKMSYVGIDFGTYSSKIANYNIQRQCAEVIVDDEGAWQMPSTVYFGKDQTLVGAAAAEILLTNDEQERLRVFPNAKQDLKQGATPITALSGRRIKPVEASAEILRALVQKQNVQSDVRAAVITYTAVASYATQERLREAGKMAGFQEVVLLAEPIAAALAYRQSNLKIGRHVLVYDLGANACTLTLLERQIEVPFTHVIKTSIVPDIGGNNFDEALYQYCNKIAFEKQQGPISLNGRLNQSFLKQCRLRKENLSSRERSWFRALLTPETIPFEHDLKRQVFEELVRPMLEKTIEAAKKLLDDAQSMHQKVDTIILVGGSTHIPLVAQLLEQALSISPLMWERDCAVALGAAWYAAQTWTPENQYHRAVSKVWEKRRFDEADSTYLDTLAAELQLPRRRAVVIEQEIMKMPKEAILKQQQAFVEYRRAVELIWQDQNLDQVGVVQLTELASTLGLNPAEAMSIEQEIMKVPKEAILKQQQAREQYERAVNDAMLGFRSPEQLQALIKQLDLKEDEAADIEQKIMGNTRENFFAHQKAREQYTNEVQVFWRDQPIDRKKVERLTLLATRLPLRSEDITDIELQVMGMTRERALAREEAREEYLRAVRGVKNLKKISYKQMYHLYALTERLQLEERKIEEIEYEILGKLKEALFLSQRARDK